MKVLVIGSGGREHALTWKLKQAKKVTSLYVAPGNPGTASIAENVSISVTDISGLVNFSVQEKIDLVVVGPEQPLSLGIVDALRKENIAVFGPSRYCAQLESSKSFAKEVMNKAGVPTASYSVASNINEAQAIIEKHKFPVVLKADGLAAGKGVIICESLADCQSALIELFQKLKAEKLVIEDFLVGKEASFIVATDGERIVPLAPAHDYKRIFDNNLGANTGGMGNVSPTPHLTTEQASWTIEHVIRPVLQEMKRMGHKFSGFLYAGLMVSPEGNINVIEFNCRLGDPETQVILPRLESDLFDLLFALATEKNLAVEPSWSKEDCVCVVMASAGYPESSSKGDVINIATEKFEASQAYLFHAGTQLNKDGQLVTNGGRVLNVVGKGSSLAKAREQAYSAVEFINFPGMQYRKDIGALTLVGIPEGANDKAN